MEINGKKEWIMKGFPKVVGKLMKFIRKEERKVKGEMWEMGIENN